ncbi:hypothetical protein GCM10011608_34310 [Micromonospora sonchi]|uniref:Uncharacterized protein n=1 Tax=Micromonospora sonchi TaxID=1763543 RepID=A0A917TZ87_9ACTN|nr:hypothetical protein GCM10011608_34310 [Micromonospora sonchi]
MSSAKSADAAKAGATQQSPKHLPQSARSSLLTLFRSPASVTPDTVPTVSDHAPRTRTIEGHDRARRPPRQTPQRQV